MITWFLKSVTKLDQSNCLCPRKCKMNDIYKIDFEASMIKDIYSR